MDSVTDSLGQEEEGVSAVILTCLLIPLSTGILVITKSSSGDLWPASRDLSGSLGGLLACQEVSCQQSNQYWIGENVSGADFSATYAIIDGAWGVLLVDGGREYQDDGSFPPFVQASAMYLGLPSSYRRVSSSWPTLESSR